MNMEIDSVLVYIEKDDLVALLKRAYEEGCFGYADLCDSTVAKIVDEYVAEQAAKVPKTPPGMRYTPYPEGLQTNVSPSMIATTSMISGIGYEPSLVTWHSADGMTLQGAGIQIQASSGHTFQLNDAQTT
jgi:hypothetical protein